MGQNQQVSITLLCPLLGISRQSFYAFFRQQAQHAFEEEIVLAEVLRIRALLPRLGTRKLLHKMQHFLGQHGFRLGRDGLFTLMSILLPKDWTGFWSIQA